MKASELRIGNLIKGIYHDYDDGIDEEIENETICKVVTLDVSGSGDYPIYVYSDEDIEHFSEFKPIPLTEEWLLKFGFEKLNTKMSDCFVFQKGLWRVAIKDNIEKTYEWVLWHERISPPTWCLSRFEYVHQLQNLYFALTGEELTLKP